MHLLLLNNITSTSDTASIRNLWEIPSVRESWTRITSANGGYYSGAFEISGPAESDILDFFNRYLGYEVQEHTINRMTWNGFIYRMTLEINGTQFTRTLEPDYFHNQVLVFYSNLAIEDTDQGVMTYRIAPLRFSDAGQDFSAWETLVGNAMYRIQVANTDNSTSWAYLGASSTVTNPNDTIAVYQDVGLTTPGWNDADPIGPPALTALSYQVIEIQFEGVRYATSWAINTDSVDAFGAVQYIISLGGASLTGAEAIRDRHLTEFGFPRTRMDGGADIIVGQQRNDPPRLSVEVAGFVATLFWQYLTVSATDRIDTLIHWASLSSVFVTNTSLAVNAMETTADCYPMPQRVGDVIQMLVDQGDAAGNAYQWGVINRTLYYGPQPTTPAYTLSGGRLYDLAGTEVIPQMLLPGVLIQTRDAPAGLLPYGGTGADITNTAYVEEVEFSAPNRLRLTLTDPDPTQVLATQLQSGSYDPTGALQEMTYGSA